ncbi:hypothetical protein HDE_11193 [Halotydeus destructor]|nr:hypothetical protein HDE_11193 [Halotydeus destructor]
MMKSLIIITLFAAASAQLVLPEFLNAKDPNLLENLKTYRAAIDMTIDLLDTTGQQGNAEALKLRIDRLFIHLGNALRRKASVQEIRVRIEKLNQAFTNTLEELTKNETKKEI